MASSSTPVSDEELQKARDGLKDLLARVPVPDEFKPPCDAEQSIEAKEKDKGKKKKLKRLEPKVVEFLINYQCTPLPDYTALAELEKKDKDKYKDLRDAFSVVDVLVRHADDRIRACQEKLRHEFETKGYLEYEVTDDEDEDHNKGAAKSQQVSREGRRRPLPGVTKRAGGGVKKIN